jgi:hypothetical protein
MKSIHFGYVRKICKRVFQALTATYILQELKFPPKFIGYLKGHRWGALVISGADGVSLEELVV